MARARARLDWDIGAAIVAMIHNVQCTSSTGRLRPDRLNPFRRGEPSGPPMPPEAVIDRLASMYCDAEKERGR